MFFSLFQINRGPDTWQYDQLKARTFRQNRSLILRIKASLKTVVAVLMGTVSAASLPSPAEEQARVNCLPPCHRAASLYFCAL